MSFTRLLDLIERLEADLSTVNLYPKLDVADLGQRTWIRRGGLAVPDDFGSEGFVLQTPVGLRLLTDSRVLDDIALTELAGTVQDWAIDELGRGWPESQGVAPGILTPVIAGGRAFWTLRGENFAPIGQLSTSGRE